MEQKFSLKLKKLVENNILVDKLCIDCGGTKVSYATFSKENVILEENSIEIPCNINVNLENFMRVVEDLKLKYNPNEVLVGVAGWIAFPNKEEVLNQLNVEIVSDVNLASITLLSENINLGVILGTGSVFFTKEQVFGGLGHSLGDEGSGYYFGKLAMKKYFEDYESDCLSGLRIKIEKTFDKSGRELLSFVLKNEKESFSKLSKMFMDDDDFDAVFNTFNAKFLSKVDFYLGITFSDQIVISGSILKSKRFMDFVSNDARFVINQTALSHAILYRN